MHTHSVLISLLIITVGLSNPTAAGETEIAYTIEIVTDSLGPDGRYYIITSVSDHFIMDTNSYFVRRGYSVENSIVYYRLNADSGYTWTMDTIGGVSRSAFVAAVFKTVIFGNISVNVKAFTYYANGLELKTDYLAAGIGLVRIDGENGPGWILRGCRINGVQYGVLSSTDDKSDPLPTNFTLEQNYPNPFNPSTVISYNLPGSSPVRLSVYTLLGKKVAEIIREVQPAGMHERIFVPDGLASGRYFYRLETKFGVRTKSMTLVR